MTLTRDARRHMARLDKMAKRADHQATLMLNSGLNEEGIRMAGDLKDEAHAIRWAIQEIEGLQAEVRQFKGAEVSDAGD